MYCGRGFVMGHGTEAQWAGHRDYSEVWITGGRGLWNWGRGFLQWRCGSDSLWAGLRDGGVALGHCGRGFV